jgi:KRAB domain-containing zinc finger protein
LTSNDPGHCPPPAISSPPTAAQSDPSPRCDICDKRFVNEHEYSQHCKIHQKTSNQINPHKCEKCGKILAGKRTLKSHRLRCQKPKVISSGLYFCVHCDQKFSTKPNLNAHLKRKHPDKIQNTNLVIKRFDCHLCPMTFPRGNELRVHLKSHLDIRDFRCDFCDAVFVTRGKLMIHTKRHTGERNYSCRFCKKDFVVKAELDRHLESHDQRKILLCSICGDHLKSEWGLKKHMKSMHSEEL